MPPHNQDPIPAQNTPLSSLPSFNDIPTPIKSQGRNKKVIIAITSIVVLIAGIGTSLVALNYRNRIRTAAWDCAAYNFSVSQTGVVSVTNGSQKQEAAQKVSVKINNVTVQTFDSPALNAGQTVTLGTVTVPTSGSFSWEVIGSTDCQDSGTHTISEPLSCPWQIVPTSGSWNYPNEFKVTNTDSKDLTVRWFLDCWEEGEKSNLCKDTRGDITLKPNESFQKGIGNICSKWQLDLTCDRVSYKEWAWGGIAEKAQSCTTGTPTVTPKATATPTKTKTPTPTKVTNTSTPTPTTVITGTPNSCNGTCGSDANCQENLVCYQGRCRNGDNPRAENCSGKGEPNSCNGTCGSDVNCKDGLVCYQGFCRNSDNPTSTTCQGKTSTTTPTVTTTVKSNPTPTPVTQLAQSGSVENTILVLGAGILFVGLAALLAL